GGVGGRGGRLGAEPSRRRRGDPRGRGGGGDREVPRGDRARPAIRGGALHERDRRGADGDVRGVRHHLLTGGPMDLEARLKAAIRDVPDFPKKGILFKDITPLLADAAAFEAAIAGLAEPHLRSNARIVAAVESRGFIFGASLAGRLKAGFVPIRKPGKLPYRTVRE